MLKPGGQFFAYMIVNKCFYNEILIEQRNEKDKPWWKYINDKPNQFVDYGSKPTDFIADVLHKAGLETIKINCERKYSTFSNIQTIKGTIGTINPYSNFIPESMRNDYMEDYLNKAMKYVQVDSDGNYYFFLDVLSVLAKKV
nr:uncharacterized protein LOC111419259 [Onthophagus taurus]